MISKGERILRLKIEMQDLERVLFNGDKLRDEQLKRLRILKEELAELCDDNRYSDAAMPDPDEVRSVMRVYDMAVSADPIGDQISRLNRAIEMILRHRDEFNPGGAAERKIARLIERRDELKAIARRFDGEA